MNNLCTTLLFNKEVAIGHKNFNKSYASLFKKQFLIIESSLVWRRPINQKVHRKISYFAMPFYRQKKLAIQIHRLSIKGWQNA